MLKPISRGSLGRARSSATALLNAGLNWLISRDRWQKRSVVLFTDTVLCVVTSWLAFSLRLSTITSWSYPLLVYVIVAVVLFPPIFIMTGTYRHIVRFSGSGTIRHLASSTTLFAVPLVVLFTVNQVGGVPRTVAIIHPILFFLALSASRILARYVLSSIAGTGAVQAVARRKQCLIYGAGVWGQQLQASLQHDPAFKVIGFIDDDLRLHRQRLNGIPVYHTDHLLQVTASGDVETVFIAILGLSQARRREIVESLSKTGVHVQIIPSMTELVEGRVSLRDLREVRIEDLLGREPVAPDEALLARVIAGKTVVVTGAGGSIGSELCRQILRAGPARLVLAEMNEANLFHIERELRTHLVTSGTIDLAAELVNVADRAQCERLMDRWSPDTVFHAAAYKHVPLIEANILAGLRNNIESTLNVARAARAQGCKHMVLVSSDKAVRPTNVMGASKRICELVLQALASEVETPIYAMVRFGNVLGSSGSVVPQFEEQIARGGPVTITHRDITRFFMTIPEAAQLVIQAGGMAKGGEVFLLDMGEPIRIADLARTMIELSGRTVRGPDNPDGDIEIREIGLRPGEKLYEELLIDCDSTITPHPRILLAREAGWPAEKLFAELEEMRGCVDRGDREGAMAIVRKLVPEYTPDASLRAFAPVH